MLVTHTLVKIKSTILKGIIHILSPTAAKSTVLHASVLAIIITSNNNNYYIPLSSLLSTTSFSSQSMLLLLSLFSLPSQQKKLSLIAKCFAFTNPWEPFPPFQHTPLLKNNL